MNLSLPALLQSLPPRHLDWMLEGLGMTPLISATIIAGGLVISLLLTALHASARPWLHLPARALMVFLHKTPSLVQLSSWYSGAIQLLGGDVVGAITGWSGIAAGTWRSPASSFEFLVVALGIALHADVFFSEKSCVSTRVVPRETALSLGFMPYAASPHVVLSQALYMSALPLSGQCANTIKNTSSVADIGPAELTYSAWQVETDTLFAFQAFITAAALYAGVILLLQWVAPRVLRRPG